MGGVFLHLPNIASSMAIGRVKMMKAKDTVRNIVVPVTADLLRAWSVELECPWEFLHFATANLYIMAPLTIIKIVKGPYDRRVGSIIFQRI